MPLFARNVDLGPPLRLSSWRKVAIGTWRTAGDPSVYGVLEADVAPATAYLDKLRASSGLKLTYSHFIGRAIAETMARHPEINCILRFGRLYPRRSVDVFFQVASDGTGQDLSGLTIRQCNTKSIPEIATEMKARIERVRNQGDPDYKKMKKTMGGLPGFLAGPLLTLSGFLLYTLNIWTSLLGTPRDPFGSVMITNIGSLGLDMGLAPLVPYSRVPLLIAMGSARETPVVRDGKLAVGLIMKLCVTFDHRLIDGVHASKMLKTLLAVLADPEKELDPARRVAK
jgi:pyruvate dehydrogenase E2 component (dihydrolipoamide acetyltransferase)